MAAAPAWKHRDLVTVDPADWSRKRLASRRQCEGIYFVTTEPSCDTCGRAVAWTAPAKTDGEEYVYSLACAICGEDEIRIPFRLLYAAMTK